jgi:two-component sensor histidine kinase/CheY-like chemotaxis protein
MDTTQIPTVGTRPRILIVDDEYLATKRIAELLELSGYDADCALSPGECMAELGSGIGFDAVILDIGFGEEEPHGGEIAAEIRDRYGVPVVFYTAHTDRETIGLTRDTDSCGIVVKAPDDAEILLASVEAAIQRGRRERETVRRLDTYHEILQGMPVPVCVFDRSTGSQLFANDAAAGLVGAASLDEYDELFTRDAWLVAGEHPTATDRASGAAWTITGPLVDRSRGRHWLVATRGVEDGRTFVVHYDVTWLCEQVRRVEHEADAAKALLRDVHHRVKNNLAVVDALIDMAQQRLHEPETLRAVRAQVHAVRVLHERLHASQRHREVDIAEYLEDIARSSLRADRETRLETAFPECARVLSGRIALPLGLIAAELATNAQKHSFVDADDHWIRVTLRDLDEAGAHELAVEFDGVPLPPDEVLENAKGSGLVLVRGLVRQLDAELTIEREPHNAFRIRFRSQ